MVVQHALGLSPANGSCHYHCCVYDSLDCVVFNRDPDFVDPDAELEFCCDGTVYQFPTDGHRTRVKKLGVTQSIRSDNIVIKCALHVSAVVSGTNPP